jgi:hypothetical protein
MESVPAATIEVWRDALNGLAASRDFSDAEDRALFRQAVGVLAENAKVSLLRRLAWEFGGLTPGPTRWEAVRALASIWITVRYYTNAADAAKGG